MVRRKVELEDGTYLAYWLGRRNDGKYGVSVSLKKPRRFGIDKTLQRSKRNNISEDDLEDVFRELRDEVVNDPLGDKLDYIIAKIEE